MVSLAKKFLGKLKWNSVESSAKENNPSLSVIILAGLIEEVFFWKDTWIALVILFFANITFYIVIRWEMNVLQVCIKMYTVMHCIDAIEVWLRYKHRNNFLKKFAAHDQTLLSNRMTKIKLWIEYILKNYIYLRQTNHAKAFLLTNMLLCIIYFMGKYLSGYAVAYLMFMSVSTLHITAPTLKSILIKIQQHSDSDAEIESLIPEVTETNSIDLCVEPEISQFDGKQSLDYWKPLPAEEDSDSSDSNTVATNLSMQKSQAVDNMETSDSDDDDDNEYIPHVEEKEKLLTTLEESQPSTTWTGSAFNALQSITDTVKNMYGAPAEIKRERLSSGDSSEGFEIINKNDLYQ